jgi:hypothetical protein
MKKTRKGKVYRAELAYHPAPGPFTMIGYMVTAPDNVNRPIALIGCDDDTDAEKLALANKVAADIEGEFDGGVYDLREYGNRDSLDAMPDFVYGLLLSGVTKYERYSYQPFFPYCRWRFAKLFQQHLNEWKSELGEPLDNVLFGYVDEGGNMSTLAFDIETAGVVKDISDYDSPRHALALAL